MAQIYLVRHTTVDVPIGSCYGLSDVPLASTLTEEAGPILQKLKDIPFDTVYSSPLTRCIRLAQILAPSGFQTDGRLTELNFGNWEGLSWDSIYAMPYGKEWMNNYLELPCPGGESYADLNNRVTSFINDLDKSQNTLIVSHAGVIRVFLSVFSGIPANEVFDVKVGFGEVVEINGE
jgi:alpha-ribazole phosphatase